LHTAGLPVTDLNTLDLRPAKKPAKQANIGVCLSFDTTRSERQSLFG